MPVHAHRTEEVTGSEGREGVNRVGGGLKWGAGTEMGTELGARTGTGMERERDRGRERGRGGNGNRNENGGGDTWTNTGWEQGRKQEQ